MQKIIISGAGICGLATALACIKKGFTVELFEQKKEISEYGAGIQIAPNGVNVCHWLGIADALQNEAFIPHQLMLNDLNDQNIFTVPIANDPTSKWPDTYYQTHRTTLINILAQKYAEKCNTSASKLFLNAKVSSYQNQTDGITITLDDGSQHKGDLLIIAEGVHSHLRKQINPNSDALYSKYLSWRCLTNIKDLDEHMPSPSTIIRIGDKKHCVSYRINRGNIVNFVGITKSREIPNNLAELANKTAYYNEFNSFPPVINKIIEKGYNYRVSGLYITPLLDKWFDGRAMLLGDAAHAMLPFMAQGASMALEDAAAIAQTITNINSGTNIKQALTTFVATRQPRLNKLNGRIDKNANMFHERNMIVAKALQKAIRFGNWMFPSIIKGSFSDIYDYNILAEQQLPTKDKS